MIFALNNILDSLAGVLKNQYPDYPVYGSPNRQGTQFPCFFIFFMPADLDGQVGGLFIRDLGIDIIFVQQMNVYNGNEQILKIAEYLDESLELFSYVDGSGASSFIRTFERQWKIEDEELHYQFHIRQRISVPRRIYPMKEMEVDKAYVKSE